MVERYTASVGFEDSLKLYLTIVNRQHWSVRNVVMALEREMELNRMQ